MEQQCRLAATSLLVMMGHLLRMLTRLAIGHMGIASVDSNKIASPMFGLFHHFYIPLLHVNRKAIDPRHLHKPCSFILDIDGCLHGWKKCVYLSTRLSNFYYK